MRRFSVLLFAGVLLGAMWAPGSSSAVQRVSAGSGIGVWDSRVLSQGARMWWDPPSGGAARSDQPSFRYSNFGSNVDANDIGEDLAAGQSESSIAAAGDRVMVAWNDATGNSFAADTTRRHASLTGVAFSSDRAGNFRDLIGLPNDNPNQQWFGDSSIVPVDEGASFIIGSLYYPVPSFYDCDLRPQFSLAVSVATIQPGDHVSFTRPIIVATGGDFCGTSPDLAVPDKPFLAFDQRSRTLAVSYTRFFINPAGGHTGRGQIEIVRGHVPEDPSTLGSTDFQRPIVIWPEEPSATNTGAYPAVDRRGSVYVAWERNWISNQILSDDPYVYIHVAKVPQGSRGPSVGGPDDPRVVTTGQVNSGPGGGVKSLDGQFIAGYNRGFGNDFPRIAINGPAGRLVIAWNDSSLHPLGDVWLRSLPMSLDLSSAGGIRKVNDDSSYALHLMPALSVRRNGTICTSWYDRRLWGPDSSTTDYFAECRPNEATNASDFRITTGETDWANTSTIAAPNFGDYTDNASTGNTTYFTWTDGRLGVPQPFVDSK